MIYFIFIGILISYILGHSPIRSFDHVRFRYPLLIIGALIIQIVLFVIFRLNPVHYAYLLEITMLLLLIGLWLNRRLSGVKWIAIGTVLNLISLLIHKGRMPVMEKALQIARITSIPDDARHQLLTESLFWWLGDWIPIYKGVLSIGDIFVGIGIILFLIINSPPRRTHETN